MRLDTIAKSVRLTKVDTRRSPVRGLGDQEIEARSVEFFALKDFVESASWCTESATTPLIDFGHSGTSRLVIVEKMNDEFHGVSLSRGRDGSRIGVRADL
ncbi:MAG: hypothetical protein ACREIH_10880 [Nitrospiraceae bacterium]